MESKGSNLLKPKRQRGAAYLRRPIVHVRGRISKNERVENTTQTVSTTTTKPNFVTKFKHWAKTLKGANIGAFTKQHGSKITRWWKWQDSRYGFKWRLANALAAIVILSSIVTPVLLQLQQNHGYQLSSATLDLVGKTDPKLTSKLTYDTKTKTYQFNKESIKEFNPADQLKQQVGTPQQDDKDKALYSLDVPQDPKKGVTYYDTNSQLSFSLVPQFGGRSGKLQQQRLVYPLGNHTQAVYTLKNNGLKEDIVVQKATEDTMRFSYTLQLPKTLEAKPMDDGSGNIGIYSANPSLFGNISYGSDADREKVEKARENGTKDTLVFGIPAPTITTSKGDDASRAKARFELKDNTLTVIAEHLTSLKQPFSIDPSVVITSTSDFQTSGNNEGNISFGSGQISRGTLSGGTVGTWTTQTAPPNSGTCGFASVHGSGIHNEYLYVMGQDCIMWAKLNTNGTINGSWTTTTGFTRAAYSGFVYNGYIYLVGGSSPNTDTTAYAKLNANGSIGSFTAGPNLTVTNIGSQLRTTVYNGYAYALGGGSGLFSFSDRIEKAAINPDGSLGAWSATTPMPFQTIQQMVNAYNGYMYITRGNGGGGLDVYYAPIASNGDIGTWIAGPSLPSDNLASRLSGSLIYRGYWYLVGGLDQALGAEKTVRYAQINANGSIGSWQLTNDLLVSGSHSVAEVYGDHIFAVTADGTNAIASALIDSPGVLRSSTSTTSFDTAANGRGVPASVANNGYLYVLGGHLESVGPTNTGKYAVLNSDGTIASINPNCAGSVAWCATSNFSEARTGATAVVYGSYLYLVGGYNQSGTANCPNPGIGADYCTNIERASIDASTGALTWSGTYTYSTTGRESPGVAIINGYMYVAGGRYNNNSTDSTEVNYAQIDSAGVPGTFNTTTVLPTGLGFHTGTAHAWAGKLYVVGNSSGGDGSKIYYATPASDGTIPASGAGSWAQTSNDAFAGTGRQRYSVTLAKGIFYLSGGYNINGLQSDIWYATIQSNGTVSNWTLLPQTLTANMWKHTMVTYNDNLYVVGGDIQTLIGDEQQTVYFYPINHGGNGMSGTWASAGTGFTGARFGHNTVAYNGFLYISGGACSGLNAACPNGFQYAPINSNGTIGTWGTDSDALANGHTVHRMLAYKGYMYITALSGANHSVQYALICTGNNNGVDGCGATAGTLGTWHLTTDFTAGARNYHGFTVYNDYLYILGGNDGSVDLSDILYAPINSSGTVGSWTAQSGGLYIAMNFWVLQQAVNNGYLYIINGASGDVRSAPINANGSIGSWTITTALPGSGTAYSYAYVANGYLYFLEGGNDGVFRNIVLYAAIGPSGQLGPWVKSANTFSTARNLLSGVYYNGNLYITGGCNGVFITSCTSLLSDVQYAPQQAIPRKALYSKLLTFNFSTSPRQITYNGLLANGNLDIAYRGSSSGTSWTGSTANASSLTNARCPSPANNKYLQLFVLFDDTQRGIFPDYSTDASNLTDLTLSYEFARAPNMRLKLGKILQENIGQTDLDICKLVAQ